MTHAQNNTEICTVRVADIPKPYKDVGELLTAPNGDALYEAMIREARPGPSWMIHHLDDVRGHDLTTTQGTVAAAADMIDTLLNQPPIARSAYVRELAEKLEVPEREVRQTLNAALRERESYYREHPDERPKPMPIRIDL